MVTTELVVIVFLLAFIVFIEIRNYHERKGLLDRIMSRDFPEYIQGESLKKPKQQGKKDPLIPI